MKLDRDPFARISLRRRVQKGTTKDDTCDWCGEYGGRYRVMEYYVEDDNNRKNVLKGRFCCIDCFRSYHT